jgi:hypothetical protein
MMASDDKRQADGNGRWDGIDAVDSRSPGGDFAS